MLPRERDSPRRWDCPGKAQLALQWGEAFCRPGSLRSFAEAAIIATDGARSYESEQSDGISVTDIAMAMLPRGCSH